MEKFSIVKYGKNTCYKVIVLKQKANGFMWVPSSYLQKLCLFTDYKLVYIVPRFPIGTFVHIEWSVSVTFRWNNLGKFTSKSEPTRAGLSWRTNGVISWICCSSNKAEPPSPCTSPISTFLNRRYGGKFENFALCKKRAVDSSFLPIISRPET